MATYKKFLFFLIATPIIFILAHYAGVFPHEYMHSLVASLTGFKSHFWNIDYGGSSIKNILLLSHIDENVNYAAMLAAHRPWLVAFTAFAGAGIGNGLTYIISLYLLNSTRVQKHMLLYYFFLLCNICSFAEFVSYVPGRTFATHGDMANITSALKISPWWLMVVFGYPVILIVCHFYRITLRNAYQHLKLDDAISQFLLLVLVTSLIFLFAGTTGLHGYGETSNFISLLLVWAAIPIIWFNIENTQKS